MSSSDNPVRTDPKRLYSEIVLPLKLTVRCQQDSDVFYFGGPLLGIDDPSLRCNPEILTNSDGTRVAFCVDPRPSASRSLGVSGEAGGEGLFTDADLDHDFSDARNPFDDAETNDAETGHLNTEVSLDGESGVSVISFSLIQPLSQQLLNTTFGTHTQYHIPTPTTQQPLNIAFSIHIQAYSAHLLQHGQRRRQLETAPTGRSCLYRFCSREATTS